jgi:hypothetical protein
LGRSHANPFAYVTSLQAPTHLVLCHAVLLGLLAASPQASDAVIRFVDVAEQAGITLLNICGDPSKDYIVEVNGNGAAFFDYDNDGDMDALIVNGSTLPNMKHGGDQMVALFQNDGKGRFADVTSASGLRARGWGMGTCVADYDNDGFQDVYVTAFGPNGRQLSLAQRHARPFRPGPDDEDAAREGTVAGWRGRAVRGTATQCDSCNPPGTGTTPGRRSAVTAARQSFSCRCGLTDCHEAVTQHVDGVDLSFL